MHALKAGVPLPDEMTRLYGHVLRAAADIRLFVEKHQPDALPQAAQRDRPPLVSGRCPSQGSLGTDGQFADREMHRWPTGEAGH